MARHRAEVEDDLVSGRLKAVVVLPADFARRLGRGETAPVQAIVDGSDPNTAALAQGYVQGVWASWLSRSGASSEVLGIRPSSAPLVVAQPRFWFNPTIDSRAALIPGSAAILTRLAVSRPESRPGPPSRPA